jgi:hypothetical protein
MPHIPLVREEAHLAEDMPAQTRTSCEQHQQGYQQHRQEAHRHEQRGKPGYAAVIQPGAPIANDGRRRSVGLMPYGRGDRVSVTCSQCGKVFTLMPSAYQQRLKRKKTKEWFHVKACYDAWKTRKVNE